MGVPLVVALCALWVSAGLGQRRGEGDRVRTGFHGNRIPIYIGGIFPDNAMSQRIYRSGTFAKALRMNNDDVRNRLKYNKEYALEEKTRFLPEIMYPMEIIDALCDTMISGKVSSLAWVYCHRMTLPVAAIIYVTNWEDFDKSTASTQYLIHLASHSGIPIIAWNADNAGLMVNRDLNDYRMLQLAPPIEHQVEAMLHILERYRWNKFSIVSSSIAGYNYFRDLFSAREADEDAVFRIQLLQHLVLSQEESSNATLAFPRLRDAFAGSESRIFLLYATKNEAKRILKAAAQVGIAGHEYLWIGVQSVIGSQDGRGPGEFPAGMLAVHFPTEANPLAQKSNALIVQIENAVSLVVRALEAMLAAEGGNLTLQSSASCDDVPDYFWHEGQTFYEYLKNVRPFTGRDLSSEAGKVQIGFGADGKLRTSYLSIMNMGPDRSWRQVGQFYKNKLKIYDIFWPGGQTSPPMGTPEKFHLKVVTIEEPPFIIMGPPDPKTGECPGSQAVKCTRGTENDTQLQCCSGFCVDLLNKLKDDVGFTYEMYRVGDGTFGKKSGGEWTGLVGDIVAGRADLCATSLSINSQRAEDIDFSVPFLKTGIAIIVRLRRGALSPTAFLEPFEYNTWVFILIVSIQAAGVSIFLFEWLSPQSYNMTTKLPTDHKFSLFRSYWLVWATLFSASVNTDVPRSHTARFMALVWAAFSLTFLAVYTANLAAFMITRSEYYDLSGIEDPRLVNGLVSHTDHGDVARPQLTYGTVKGGNTHQILQGNYRRQHYYINAGADLNPMTPDDSFFRGNVEDGVRAVKTDALDAFVYDAVRLEYLSGKDDDCEILTVGKWFSTTGYGLGLKKGDKIKDKIDQFILKYQQRGDLELLQNFWLTGACSAKKADGKTQSSPLGIENFLSAFVLLAGGTIVGLLVLSCEFLYCFKLRRSVSKMDRFGVCGLLSLSMAKSLRFDDAAEQVFKEQQRKKRLDSLRRTDREMFLEEELRRVNGVLAAERTVRESKFEAKDEKAERRTSDGRLYRPVRMTEETLC